MRLLHAKERVLREFPSDSIPRYAILSHTWGEQEISLQDIKAGNAEELRGYEKVKMTCFFALERGFEYVWIDTCCIDKTSSAELSEALNSMYRWYQEAEVCYAYLADVSLSHVNAGTDVANREFQDSKWFTRGWTLQELLAPEKLIFLNKEWHEIGTKSGLHPTISQITRVPGAFLLGEDLNHASIAQRMSWASARRTTRKEDLAYSLMGIFGIYMPMLYGEGERAFIRLQEEIMKISDDHSIFAWKSTEDDSGRVAILATSPAAFAESSSIIPTNPAFAMRSPAILTSRGIYLSLQLASHTKEDKRAILQCTEKGKENKRFTIYLKDTLLNNEDFVRVKSTELELIDVGSSDLSKYHSTNLYVRQWLPIHNQRRGNTSTCEVKLGDMAEEDVASYITNHNSYCELASGQITMDILDIPDGIFGRLFVMCQDGNFFQVVLKKYKGSVFAEIATTISSSTNKGHSAPSRAESQQNQDHVLEKLGDGQTIHIAIEEQIHLRQGRKRPMEVVKISYSNKIGQMWLEHMIIWGNKIGKEFLWCAVDREFQILVKQILDENKDDDRQTILSRAAKGGQERLVKELLEKGVNASTRDKEGWTPLSYAAEAGNQSVVDLLLSQISLTEQKGESRSWNLLLRSALRLLSTKSTRLESRGGFESEDGNGWMPLSLAAQNGHEAVVKLLLEKGAAIDSKDNSGRTPLARAAENGHEAVVKLLLEKGAAIDSGGSGTTPLVWAAKNGHEAVVKLLLEKGAAIDSKNNSGRTSLSFAAQNGHEAIVKLLLEKGAAIDSKDNWGRTPLVWAVRNRHEAIVKLLREKEAVIKSNDNRWKKGLASNLK